MDAAAYFVTGGALWIVGMFCAWSLVHGAEKLRRQHEAVAGPALSATYNRAVHSRGELSAA